MNGETHKKLRGFAALTKERHKEISALGGREAKARQKMQQKGAFSFDSTNASKYGQKGGQRTAQKYGQSYMQKIGKAGGIAASYENPADFYAKEHNETKAD